MKDMQIRNLPLKDIVSLLKEAGFNVSPPLSLGYRQKVVSKWFIGLTDNYVRAVVHSSNSIKLLTEVFYCSVRPSIRGYSSEFPNHRCSIRKVKGILGEDCYIVETKIPDYMPVRTILDSVKVVNLVHAKYSMV